MALDKSWLCGSIGHIAFEKNKTAIFRHPLYSFMGDWVMLKVAMIGRILC